LHAIYLINLVTPNEDSLKKGIDLLIKYMNLAADIGAAGVIFHPGSHGGRGYEAVLPETVDAIKTVLDASPDGPCLAVENMAGMGQHIGAKFDELGGILKAVDSPRLKICLDTQHAFAAGYDLTNPQGIKAMLDELDAGPGSANVAAVHANDSKRVCGSGVDRHDNIGDGFIGEEGWVYVNRGKIDASNRDWLKSGFNSGKFKAYKSGNHTRNFLECVKSRKPAICPAETSHRSITPGHLGYVSNALGRALKWDPKKEQIVGDREASALLNKMHHRKPWTL